MVFLYPRPVVGGPSSAAVGAGTPRRVVERRRRRADGARERESGARVTDRVRVRACVRGARPRDRETARPRIRAWCAFVNSFAHSPTAATRRARARDDGREWSTTDDARGRETYR